MSFQVWNHTGPSERWGWDRSRVAELHLRKEFLKKLKRKIFLKQVLQNCQQKRTQGWQVEGRMQKGRVNAQPTAATEQKGSTENPSRKVAVVLFNKADQKIIQKWNAFSKLGILNSDERDSNNFDFSSVVVLLSSYQAPIPLGDFYYLKFSVSVQKAEAPDTCRLKVHFSVYKPKSLTLPNTASISRYD